VVLVTFGIVVVVVAVGRIPPPDRGVDEVAALATDVAAATNPTVISALAQAVVSRMVTVPATSRHREDRCGRTSARSSGDRVGDRQVP
jgi:hypothetical protein